MRVQIKTTRKSLRVAKTVSFGPWCKPNMRSLSSTIQVIAKVKVDRQDKKNVLGAKKIDTLFFLNVWPVAFIKPKAQKSIRIMQI